MPEPSGEIECDPAKQARISSAIARWGLPVPAAQRAGVLFGVGKSSCPWCSTTVFFTDGGKVKSNSSTVLRAGTLNKVPDRCEMAVDVRYLPRGLDATLAAVRLPSLDLGREQRLGERLIALLLRPSARSARQRPGGGRSFQLAGQVGELGVVAHALGVP